MVDIDAAAKRIALERFNIDNGDVGAYGDWVDLPFIRTIVEGFVHVSAEHWELMAEIWVDGYLTGQWRALAAIQCPSVSVDDISLWNRVTS